MGKRVDAILIHEGIVFAIEFKVGTDHHSAAAIDQVTDYAYKQAQAIGAPVKAGERSTRIVYPNKMVVGGEGDDAKIVGYLKNFNVFNISQMDGIAHEAPLSSLSYSVMTKLRRSSKLPTLTYGMVGIWRSIGRRMTSFVYPRPRIWDIIRARVTLWETK